MRFVHEFAESTLHDVDNNFSIRAIYKKSIVVELSIPQYRIVSTLQDFIDSKPKRIELFWSKAPVFSVIVKELEERDYLDDEERLEILLKRCPYLYGYRFNQRK